jgi:hypothetical protein
VAVIRALRVLGSIRISARDPSDLPEADVDELYAFCTTLVQRDRDEFGRTLAGCDRLYEVRRAGRLVGLSTARVSLGEASHRPAVVVEAKWAWLAPEVRGAHVPPLLTFLALRDVWRRHPGRDVYGMLTAATEHSFVMVHRYARRAWPHPDAPTPPALQALLDEALTRHAGEAWDREAGVVRGRRAYAYRAPQRAPRADPEAARLAAWYHERNPGQADGDCLPMLVPLDARQLAGIAWRAARGR